MPKNEYIKMTCFFNVVSDLILNQKSHFPKVMEHKNHILKSASTCGRWWNLFIIRNMYQNVTFSNPKTGTYSLGPTHNNCNCKLAIVFVQTPNCKLKISISNGCDIHKNLHP